MRQVLKRASGLFLVPLVRWYLKTKRHTTIAGLSLNVWPTVFHPGLFGSTRFMIEYIDRLELKNRTVLDLGCGSGAIGLFCAKRGALVTAVDINRQAVMNTIENARTNSAEISVCESDLFAAIPSQQFDFIFINPPYYAKKISSVGDLAWHCGEDFGYFRRLFTNMLFYINDKSIVLMVLTKACDLKVISEIASENYFSMKLMKETPVLFEEKLLVFQIQEKRR